MNRAEKRRQQKLAEKAAKKGGGLAVSQGHAQVLNHAVDHHQAGRLRDADRLYRQVLKSDPAQPVALNLSGVIAHQSGNNELAVDLIGKALVAQPDYDEAHNNLGLALQELGRNEEAAASFMKAVSFKPDYLNALYNLANVLRDLGRLNEAVTCLERVLVLKPDFLEAHKNLGNILIDLGKFEEAIVCFKNAVSRNADFAEAHYGLGVAFEKKGALEEAVERYQQALILRPDYADARNNLGTVYKELGNLDGAVDCYRAALLVKPDYARAHNNLGLVLEELGQLKEAADSFRSAITHDPDKGEPHRNLANVTKFSDYDADIQSMEDLYAHPDLSDEQRMHLAFGLGKAFEDLKEYEKAFEFLLTGNTLKRSTFEFSIRKLESEFKGLKTTFTKSLFKKFQKAGFSDEAPIFILGMPRSGTTLVEQILASHPSVYGAGELEILSNLIKKEFGSIFAPEFAGDLKQGDAERFSEAGGQYIAEIRKLSANVPFITDKMPQNFQYIGLIKLILPQARVIHCCRDPRDNCLSILKNYFTADGHYYAYDLSELGQYYTLYRDLMAHWHHVLPGYLFDIQYEALVRDQEMMTRKLLEFCELEWDDACLSFHKTKRSVQTASSAQVRRPIYKSSVKLWERYKLQLEPLLEVLGKNEQG